MKTQSANDHKNTDPSEASDQGRRDFIKTSALVGGCAALGAGFSGCSWQHRSFGDPKELYAITDKENIAYSTCLQCHVACPIKVMFRNGVALKIGGNPYSPQNYLPHLEMDTSLDKAARTEGKLCAKGQAGIQTYYDPYRLRKVLKRAGPRGSGKWESIPFERFIDEVARGGSIFKNIGDQRNYPGFEETVALRDPKLAKAMAADAAKFGKGELELSAFKEKYKQHLDLLIDPDHPDLGPKNNQFVFAAGRIEHGRKELMKRFTNKTIGSMNAFEHTSICEVSHHIAYKRITQKTTHMKPDLMNCEFVLFWGTGAFTANFGLTPMAEKVTTGKVDRGMKTAVVDPRLSADAGKADWWLPIKPGTDGALAMAMIRWIIENERFDQTFLSNANQAAAAASGESSWTDASLLVKIVDGHPFAKLTADEIGIGTSKQNVVSKNGSFIAVGNDKSDTPVQGELFYSGKAGDFEVKSSLQLLRDEAFKHSLSEYSSITHIPLDDIGEVARELTSHGKRAAVELYRGVAQHTDGYYAASAAIQINMLIGNIDWKGGLQGGGSHWHEFGGKSGNLYQFADMHPGSLKAFGPRITREKSRYEDFSLFREKGYPAQRPWYPFSSNIYQEIIPSFASGYPYKGKILFLHMGTPALASPAGNTVIDMLKDPDRVPLFIASDIVIGETSMYADYIMPDITFLERWGTPHTTPDVPTISSKIRIPTLQPLTETVSIDGEEMPLCLETFLIALAKKLKLSGFGNDAFGPGLPFNRMEDWFMKAIVNIAFGDKQGDTVPDATDEEIATIEKGRRHLPATVFDIARLKASIRPEEWRKAAFVLSRGGRFGSSKNAYDGLYMKKRLGRQFRFFADEVAQQANSISGKLFSGVATYQGQFDSSGKSLPHSDEYPYTVITYKEPFGGHSRTISNYWTNIAMMNENSIVMNKSDVLKNGLDDGQIVRLVSRSNPTGTVDLGDGRTIKVEGHIKAVEGMKPGVIGVSWHYGHWAYGSNDVEVDGAQIKGDRRRAAGLCSNAVLDVDPIIKDVCLTDPIGASASFFDTEVNLKPINS